MAFTYGYIREAVMAHLDIDEEEAQAMNLLSRFHIYANEAMQAICASKPKYQYIDVTVVDKFAPLIRNGASFIKATESQINWNIEEQGEPDFIFASEEETKKYYHDLGIYERGEIIPIKDTFIAFANKACYKVVNYKPSVKEELEAEMCGRTLKHGIVNEEAVLNDDFTYIGNNCLKFYRSGYYLIPARYMWFRFDSGIKDTDEINMPSDILLTIPLYIAAICLAIDNVQAAQLMKQDFEIALARCTNTDFMPLPTIEKSW